MSIRQFKPSLRYGAIALSALWFSLLACNGGSTADDDDDDNNNDSADDELDCKNLEWSPEEHYLTNDSIVSEWDQTAFIDVDENGKIDKEEYEDEDVTYVDLCEKSADGKRSLVLLMATDD